MNEWMNNISSVSGCEPVYRARDQHSACGHRPRAHHRPRAQHPPHRANEGGRGQVKTAESPIRDHQL